MPPHFISVSEMIPLFYHTRKRLWERYGLLLTKRRFFALAAARGLVVTTQIRSGQRREIRIIKIKTHRGIGYYPFVFNDKGYPITVLPQDDWRVVRTIDRLKWNR